MVIKATSKHQYVIDLVLLPASTSSSSTARMLRQLPVVGSLTPGYLDRTCAGNVQ